MEAERRVGSPRVLADASPPGPETVAWKGAAWGESPAVPVLYLQTAKCE